MSTYSITFSPTGGTKKVAVLFANAYAEEYIEIDLTEYDKDFSVYSFKEKDVCIVSVPSFAGRAPITAVERLAMMQGNGAKAVLIAVYGNREFEDTLAELEDVLGEAGFVPVAAVAALAEHSMIREYAKGRPDENDEKVLADFAEQIKDKMDCGKALNKPVIPGDRPYKERKPLPAIPVLNENCVKCGLCAKVCPVQAIPEDLSVGVEKEACISCMRCIAICPVQARSLPAPVVNALNEKLSVGAKGYKENKLYL